MAMSVKVLLNLEAHRLKQKYYGHCCEFLGMELLFAISFYLCTVFDLSKKVTSLHF